MAKAFRGELVPQDPNDEHAEKLLERIREEKEKKQEEREKRNLVLKQCRIRFIFRWIKNSNYNKWIMSFPSVVLQGSANK